MFRSEIDKALIYEDEIRVFTMFIARYITLDLKTSLVGLKLYHI